MTSQQPKWSDLFGIDPDYPLTDRDQAQATIADLQARLAETEAQLAAARAALAACREVAAKRAGR